MIRNLLTIGMIIAVAMMITACGKGESQNVESVKNGKASCEVLKIAYVEVDSINSQYEYCKEYTEILKKKSETIQSTLNTKAIALQKQLADFQSKMQNGTIRSEEEANKQQTILQQKQMQLQELQQSLAEEFEKEQNKFNADLRDSLQNFLKSYNKTHGYTYIISKAGDNILWAEKKYDITKDVISGLNKRYKGKKK
ncbi:MAG: OmpH family outer membrane protein [Prevotellaceae bacterium]|nr:OmpH family outer membrane protein [Candidatus Faecinaster equi]